MSVQMPEAGGPAFGVARRAFHTWWIRYRRAPDLDLVGARHAGASARQLRLRVASESPSKESRTWRPTMASRGQPSRQRHLAGFRSSVTPSGSMNQKPSVVVASSRLSSRLRSAASRRRLGGVGQALGFVGAPRPTFLARGLAHVALRAEGRSRRPPAASAPPAAPTAPGAPAACASTGKRRRRRSRSRPRCVEAGDRQRPGNHGGGGAAPHLAHRPPGRR